MSKFCGLVLASLVSYCVTCPSPGNVLGITPVQSGIQPDVISLYCLSTETEEYTILLNISNPGGSRYFELLQVVNNEALIASVSGADASLLPMLFNIETSELTVFPGVPGMGWYPTIFLPGGMIVGINCDSTGKFSDSLAVYGWDLPGWGTDSPYMITNGSGSNFNVNFSICNAPITALGGAGTTALSRTLLIAYDNGWGQLDVVRWAENGTWEWVFQSHKDYRLVEDTNTNELLMFSSTRAYQVGTSTGKTTKLSSKAWPVLEIRAGSFYFPPQGSRLAFSWCTLKKSSNIISLCSCDLDTGTCSGAHYKNPPGTGRLSANNAVTPDPRK